MVEIRRDLHRHPELGLEEHRTSAKVQQTLEELRSRSMNIAWTDTQPVIDGQMDDACWQDAEVVGEAPDFGGAAMHAVEQGPDRITAGARPRAWDRACWVWLRVNWRSSGRDET